GGGGVVRGGGAGRRGLAPVRGGPPPRSQCSRPQAGSGHPFASEGGRPKGPGPPVPIVERSAKADREEDHEAPPGIRFALALGRRSAGPVGGNGVLGGGGAGGGSRGFLPWQDRHHDRAGRSPRQL